MSYDGFEEALAACCHFQNKGGENGRFEMV
jgi:hypothetical protein